MHWPRIKAEHAPYRTAGEKIRIGGGVHGVAAEITDPGGWLWSLLCAIDGSSEPAHIIRQVCRAHPDELKFVCSWWTMSLTSGTPWTS